jgi:hypothetical protein
MGSDGSTFIDRVEGIEISTNNNNLAYKGKLLQRLMLNLGFI